MRKCAGTMVLGCLAVACLVNAVNACSSSPPASAGAVGAVMSPCSMHIQGEPDSGLGSIDFAEDGSAGDSRFASTGNARQPAGEAWTLCTEDVDGGGFLTSLQMTFDAPLTAPTTIASGGTNYRTFTFLVDRGDGGFECTGHVFPGDPVYVGDFTMTIRSVTPLSAADMDDAGDPSLSRAYVIHGAAHGTCPPFEATGHSVTALGVAGPGITFDLTF